MGIIIRQSIKGSIANYIGILLGALNTIILFPYFLTASEIGTIETLRSFALLIVPFVQLGSTHMIIRFFPEYNSTKKSLNAFWGLILSIAFLGFCAFISIWMFWGESIISSTSNRVIYKYSMLLYCLVFYSSFISLLSTYATILQRITFPNLMQFVILRIFILLIIYFYFLKLFDFNIFLFWFVQIHALPIIAISIYIYKLRGNFIGFSTQLVNWATISKLSVFGLFTILATMSHIVINKIDIIMIGKMTSDLSKAGIYSIAFYMGSVIEIPKRTISSIAMPIISNAFKNNDISSIETIYKKTAINQLIISLLILGIIWFNIDLIFHIMPNGIIYKSGKQVVLFIALGKTIDMLMGCNIEIITVSKYYKFSLISSILLAILTVITNYIFINLFDLTGAAIASMITILLYNLINYLFIYYQFKLSPFNKNTPIALIIGIICFAICLSFPTIGNIYIDAIIASGLYITLLAYMIYRYKISEDFNTIILNCLKFLKII